MLSALLSRRRIRRDPAWYGIHNHGEYQAARPPSTFSATLAITENSENDAASSSDEPRAALIHAESYPTASLDGHLQHFSLIGYSVHVRCGLGFASQSALGSHSGLLVSTALRQARYTTEQMGKPTRNGTGPTKYDQEGGPARLQLRPKHKAHRRVASATSSSKELNCNILQPT